ncbi:MAG TPA: hypothetical protein PLZ55_06160, partial [bacterium]|nr:hypothetical protein [bacterium]
GKPTWLLLAGVNNTYVLFCNGEHVNSFGEPAGRGIAVEPTAAELTSYLRYGERNLIAIQVFDRGDTGGVWLKPCVLTTELEKLNAVRVLSPYVLYEEKDVVMQVDLLGLGNERPEGKLILHLFKKGSDTAIAEQELPLKGGAMLDTATFHLPNVQDGTRYRIGTTVMTGEGKVYFQSSVDVQWPVRPVWPDEGGDLTVRNNFVTDLLVSHISSVSSMQSTFFNPREGWVLFSVVESAQRGEVMPSLYADGESEPLILRSEPSTGALEAMRYLSKGEHRLRIVNCAGQNLIVRAVPELFYGYHPSGPQIPAFGTYDWAYLKRNVLSHVNTIVTSGGVAPEEFEEWRREGRKWIVGAGLPGMQSNEAPAPEDVYKSWSQNLGVTDPLYGGIVVDEFLLNSPAHYESWTKAVKRLHEDPNFKGKKFYAYCSDLCRDAHLPSIPFVQALIGMGDRFALERYLPEQPTEREAQLFLLEKLQRDHAMSCERAPGWAEQLVFCFGYFSAPPEMLNTNPGADYRVWLDMQYHLVATDPTFWGTYGIMEFVSSYADEEMIRWAAKLYRHYCIEGNRNRLTEDPYELPHLVNPDFANGDKGWDLEPAKSGSITPGYMEGYSWLEGRYPRTRQGDHFLRITRAASGPNRIRQIVKKLEPGRLYSFKLISTDPVQLDKQQTLALSIQLGNVEILEDKTFQHVYPNCSAHEWAPYNSGHPAYLNYHRLVFRPKQETSELVISDWASPTDPGGPVGQTIGINFIEIQPYLEP